MKIEIQKEWFSVAQCEANPNKLYIFGDNDLRKGKGGQAIIRDCENAFGIPTKRKPSMEEDSFYDDSVFNTPKEFLSLEIYNQYTELFESVCVDILYKMRGYEVVVLPADGLGTGLAQMDKKAPKLWEWLNKILCIKLKIEKYP